MYKLTANIINARGTSCSMSRNQPKLGKKTAKGRRISSQSKYIVENVRAFFEKEKLKGSFIKTLLGVKRTTEATGLSLRTINRIHQEYISHDGQFMMPFKRYGVSRIRINPNSFDREIIRRIIHNVYCRKEYPTLCSVLEEEFGFPGGRFCLWRVLKEMGYSYKKKDNKQFLYEQRSILEQRDTYLQQIRQLRQQNVNLVYTDET